MNVLFVFYVPSGGVETLNRQRSKALKPAGIDCDFLYYSKKRSLINHESNVFITNNDQEIKKILAAKFYSAIVIISDYVGIERFRKLGYKGKIIFEVQGYGAKHVARSEMKKAIPYINNYCDGLLYPKTQHIGEIFKEFFPTVPKFAFNNCFDSLEFTYKAQVIKESSPIIAWIGRLEDNKNWREFLEIGNRLVIKNPLIKLYMFEDPSLSTIQERNEFNKTVTKFNLQKKLSILQNIPHQYMPAYFSKIGDSGGLLCSTSKVEGAPYSILEAMSCNCPILTTDSDGVRTSVIHNHTGKYYRIGNINEAVNQAEELIFNKPLRNKIIYNASLHVKSQFSHEQYQEHFVKMLRSIGV
ncbi:glycosyltransferase family 4 protein [Rossellomorea sp. KS-H15a]|uniref:glycosyltransferase family 4 protein n=1 Tax=Rossellomorea sp. KS-H15a TaxID=2963940 RepID=UPI0020C6829A|nr:glycosyltransferase family 4 protein [Rossellomorea sp. KS-H15a]UTE75469.1 glycosyltransferase family 4 protein [Rossellomorea sp. KS-H15a]